MKKVIIPKSCTSLTSSFLGLFGLLGALLFLKYQNNSFNIFTMVIVLLATALPMMLYDFFVLKVYKRNSSGLNLGLTPKRSLERSLTKIIGLIGTIVTIAFFYWLFPEYHGGFYMPWWVYLKVFGVIFILLTPFYIYYIDGLMSFPKDGLWQAGLLFQGRFEELDKGELKQHFLGWAVKGFFLPLMVVYCAKNLQGFIYTDWSNGSALFFYHRLHDFIYLIDLAFVVIGYSVSLRIFDSHIRSSEGTMIGWFVALLCYQPFWAHFSNLYFQYSNTKGWLSFVRPGSALFYFWAGIILILIIIYSLSSVSFGLRFSNLTNRGIITNGPYAFTKHPAYVSKNISWWLISTPFLFAGSWESGLRQCLMLFLLNAVYFLRARTEERHLSNDPTYREYALGMNEKSIFNKLGNLIPYLKYKP